MTNAKTTHQKNASHQRQPKTSTHPTHNHNHQQTTQPISLIGTRTTKCDICKTTKKTYLLNYGFSLCAECIDICALILEQLQLDETQPPTNKAAKPKPTECIATGE